MKARGLTMRADGTRVQNLTAIMQALPYIMPKRYDAQNWAEENLDEDAITGASKTSLTSFILTILESLIS